MKDNQTKKYMFLKFNVTGRIFLCVGEDIEYLDPGNEHFTQGNTYIEALVDNDGMNVIKKDEDVILLRDKNNIPLYVDAKHFILSNDTINPMAFENPICLN